MLQLKEEPTEHRSARPAEEERLISEHISLIKLHASRLATQLFSAEGVDQLIDAGAEALLGAVSNYHEANEQDFKDYADRCIRAAMSEQVRLLNGTHPVKMPHLRKRGKTSEKLRPKLKYDIKDLELAMALGIDVEQLASYELMAQIGGLSIGGFSEAPKACPQAEAAEKLYCYEPEPESESSSCYLVKEKRILRILSQVVSQLPTEERLVTALHYHEELTMPEIASVLRMAEWRVLQLHTKAVLRLRTRLRLHLGCPHE